MTDVSPIIVVEPAAVLATVAVANGYSVEAFPRNGSFDFTGFNGRKVILWPDASEASRTAFRGFAERITDLCEEIKLIIPNGKAHGWNIASAVAEGMDWKQLAVWAKSSMMVFGRGQFPKNQVEVTDAPDPMPASTSALWEQLGIAMGANQQPIMNTDNVVRILSGWSAFSKMIWFDEFHQRYFTNWNSDKPREWKDIDDINFTVLLQREFGFPRINQETVSMGIRCRGFQCKSNEPKEWMRALRWDGRPRVDEFFGRYLGVVDNGYTRAVSRNFWIGMVARIFKPGCQLDNMVIFEGKQGIFKSRALEAIGGKWYMEASEEITSKDFFGALQGKLLVEIADLDSFSRADTNRIKKVITCRTDRFRVPYGRTTQDHPRQSIFVGTTNEQHYLRDSTGARRFWPIQCGTISLEQIHRDREQLFAEAVSRYMTNEDWYTVPQAATSQEQEERRQYDEWENIIEIFIRDSCQNETTLTQVAAHVGVDKAKMDINVQRRLGSILRRMGWISSTKRTGDFTQRVWISRELQEVQAGLRPSLPSAPPLPGLV